ncbi:glycosyltransferase family 4 protein [Shewanella scandinavica]|uniref:Glycosyltransferase family 4 protein n=1 Tax=Shewanella scandinavica TaxID=3063538 RepID=A0ABU3FUF1_9GAMM|nr:glycosyltransferase family 4 protein [Shewanella sp. SP2S1-2]MDT3278993.1 glycosyltransferase family 4 protein [Shewanella sp. SP2S1-2]
MESNRVVSVIIQDGQGGIEVVSKLNTCSLIVHLNKKPKFGFLGSQYGVLFCISSVFRILKENDVVMTNLPIHHMVFSLINLFYKRKHIAVEHGPWVFAIGAKTHQFVSWFYQFWLKKSKLDVVCVSKDLFAMYNLIRNNNHYIPNAICDFESVKSHSSIDDVLRFVFVGRFDYQKDVQLAIEAYLSFKRASNKKCIFDLYGSGKDMEGILEKYSSYDDINFKGYNNNARNLLCNYDICLVTSRFEGLPGIVLESLYAGCRVVTTPFISGLLELAVYPNIRVSRNRDIISIVESISSILDVEYDPLAVRVSLERTYSQPLIKNEYSKLFIKNECY